MEIREALTFDDVLLVPGASSVLPSTADTRTWVTKSSELNILWEIRGEYLIKSQKTERSKVKQKRKKNQLLLLRL